MNLSNSSSSSLARFGDLFSTGALPTSSKFSLFSVGVSSGATLPDIIVLSRVDDARMQFLLWSCQRAAIRKTAC